MAEKSPERLPAGWKEESKVQKNGRRMKYYMNCSTGQKFYSKADLLRYVKMERTQLLKTQPTNSHGKMDSENNSMKLVAKENLLQPTNGLGKRNSEDNSMKHVAEENNHPDWLPDGWVVDLRNRKSGTAIGKQYKVYIDPLTGCKFFSKPEVLRYLESVKHGNLASERKTTRIGMDSASKVMVEKSAVDDLPPGRVEKSAVDDLPAGLVENSAEDDLPPERVENSAVDDLPPERVENSLVDDLPPEWVEKSAMDDLPLGWIKETKIKKTAHGIRKDPHVAEENNHSDWLPDGWVVDLRNRKSGTATGKQYKVYIDPLTGCKFFSKPEVLRYLESLKHRNLTCERKTTRIGMHSASKVMVEKSAVDDLPPGRVEKSAVDDLPPEWVEKSTVDDLPPGWIKETKIKKTAHGFRKDPFYTDPVSGYVFNSKKAVFHYLETGIISKYAFKPTKRSTDDPELINEKALTLPAAKRQKLEHPTTRRRLFPVKESPDVCSPALEEAEVLKKRWGKGVSAGNGLAGAPTAEQMTKTGIKKGAETMEIPGLSGSAQPKFKGSKRNEGKKVFADNGSVSTPPIYSLLGQRLSESGFECSNRKSLNALTKSEKKKELNFPRRSSKRLAGLEPELQLKAGSVMEYANQVSSKVNIPSSGEPSNTIKSSGNQAITGEKMQKLKSAETNGDNSKHLSLYFGDSYLDPCLESAFKALMGEISVNSNPHNGPVSTSAADILLEKNLQETKEEKSSKKRGRGNPTKSKNKQELNLPRRSSKRLAGNEPEMVDNCVSIETGCKNITAESRKSKPISTSDLTSSGLVDEASPQHKAGPVKELSSLLLSEINIPSHGEPSSKTKSLENQATPGEQSAESNDEKSEPHVSLSLGESYLDTCKSLMGEIPVDCMPGKGSLSTTAADIPLEKNLQETKVEKSSNIRTCINSSKSKNKQERKLPCRSSKRLAGLEPELAPNLISVEGCGDVAIEYCRSKVGACAGMDPQGLAEGASQEPKAGNETTHAQHDTGTPLHDDLSNENGKPLEAQTIPEQQSQKLENEKPGEQTQMLKNERMDHENPDSQLFPFGDSWSDPCLEFAFKTLTGAIPVDDNMEIQDYFQHRLDPSQEQKDDGSISAGFGLTNDGSVPPGFGSTNESSVLPGFGSTNNSSVPPGFWATSDSSVPPGFGATNDSSVPPGFGATNDSSVPPSFGATSDSSVPPGFGATNDSSVPSGFGASNDSSVLPNQLFAK